MDRRAVWGEGVLAFVHDVLEGDLHGKRVLSLADATLGVMVSASLAVVKWIPWAGPRQPVC